MPPCLQDNNTKNILKGYFTFLNQKIYLGCPPDWNSKGMSKLWFYNLHYFDYIWTLNYHESKKLVLDWIEKYPLNKNTAGWEPYPVSLRLMNWCCVFFYKFLEQTESDSLMLERIWKSIYIQAEWLFRHIETHLLGNHLLENAAALLFAGSCFDGDAAKRWFLKGREILKNEISEQILPDGMHFERSSMYHLRIAYLFANLLNIDKAELNCIIEPHFENMLEAIRKITHPDGDISLLNDSAFKIYNAPEQLLKYAGNNSYSDISQTGTFVLPQAGYFGFRGEDGTYIICDAGVIGPDYIPGHSHADIFSFELSLKGHRVIVDSGVYDYEIGKMREYCRSTKAHNTIEIDGQDQCEMWGAFRVAKRGRPFNIEWKPSVNGFQLSAAHDGYKRLKGNPLHCREFIWDKTGFLSVRDRVTSSFRNDIKSRIHLHPDCQICEINKNTAWIKYPVGEIRITFYGPGRLTVDDSFYCPEFGVKTANKSLVFSLSGSSIETGFQLEAL